MSVALVKIQIRNDTAQAWAVANPVLSDGEPGAESNTGRLKIGNGIDRWIALPDGGGDGSGGSEVNPITGNIDGGIYTGNPRTAEAGPPIQPVTSYAYVGDSRVFVCSWAPASVDDPSTTTIQYYVVEVTQTPSDETTWAPCGASNVPPEEVKNFAIVNTPEVTDPTGSYWYRVKAVLSTGGLGEWGYTPEFRHFREPQKIEFDLTVVPDTNEIGSTGEDNVAVITVENFSGDYTGPPTWTYPAVTGLVYTEDNSGDNPLLRIENTQGIATVEQTLVIQCTYAGEYQGLRLTIPDDSFVVSKSVSIVLKNTSDDPGPGPGPEPTPGDTLPIFSWELVENAAEVPPGLETSATNGWSNNAMKPQAEQPTTTFIHPPGWYPSYRNQTNCVGNTPCPNPDFDGSLCGVSAGCEIEFTDFTLILNARAGQSSLSATATSMEPQYKKILVAGGASCTSVPIEILTDSGSENLEMRNPLYCEAFEDDEQTRFFSSYQTLDNVSINGVSASYLLLRPEKHGTGSTLDGASTWDQMTGMLLKTFDGGSTFQYVDPRGIGVTQVNILPYINNNDEAEKQNRLPWILFKATSVSNGREVLVAGFKYASDSSSVVQQFYFTDDHIVWQPCTNADLLTDTVDKVWTDPATGITYATDAIHDGELTVGVCSYYKSEPS